jgi:anti-sigma B factor antagonist
MSFKVTYSPISYSPIDRDALHISVEGELDLVTTVKVQADAETAISDRRPVLLDLSRCSFIDSTGLRMVLQVHRGLTDGERQTAPLAVVANSEIRRLFSITGIDRRVPVFLAHEQALESIRANRGHINSPRSTASHPTIASAEGHAA